MYSNIASAHDYLRHFEDQISIFGRVSRGNKKYVFRKNVNYPFPDKGAYFGCISEGEDASGTYSDLSIVVFPSNEPNDADSPDLYMKKDKVILQKTIFYRLPLKRHII